MSYDRTGVANEAHDFFGDPPNKPNNNWWDNVKQWVTDHIKPIVPAAQLTSEVLRIIELIKKLFGGNKDN